MPRLQFLALVLFTTACSGSDDKAEPCSASHRSGTYVQTFQERDGGTCGPLQDQVVALDPNKPAVSAGSGDLDCALDSDDVVSADQCKLTRAYTCVAPDGSRYSFVGISAEQDGGATLTGTLTAQAYKPDGSIACRSTYDVTYSRQ